MALLNPTFVFGVVVLLYLSSFVLFALLRIITGISIQRIGYFSLRRLAYTPKDGVKVEIRGLGLNLHRPTFAQPTWLSVVLTELVLTVDLKAISGDKGQDEEDEGSDDGAVESTSKHHSAAKVPPLLRRTSFGPRRSKSWEQLTKLKERIKRLHRKINWIRLVDVVTTNTTINLIDVGTLQVGSFTMAVDTRTKMVDRKRMFSHSKVVQLDQRPAEWMITLRSILFTPLGRESLEVLDHATLNIHGLLYKELDGLRDASIALKLGRVHIPYDDIKTCVNRYKGCKRLYREKGSGSDEAEISVADLIEEFDRPGSREENLVRTVSDSKEFISSILRGIKEVQFAVSFVGFSKQIRAVQLNGAPIYITASMKEVGVDLHRLDQKSPAHRMYFSSSDVAHQALVAALSIAIGLADGQGKSERLMYVPMATTTIRTTLPSKTVEFGKDNSADERNANILFANVVVTSPSIDLDPKHLPLVLGMLTPTSRSKRRLPQQRHILISRLLPKANVKFSMHEPVIRIALPAREKAEDDDFDLLISSVSSISLDIESSHSAVGELHYSLASTVRLQSLDLYYQTSVGARYDLLQTESLELKVQVNANPEVYVVASANLQTFSIHMIRPEISDGVRQIVRQLRLNVEPDKKARPHTSRDPNFVRALPPWLLHFQLQGSDFSAEVAGVDEDISDDTRGVALQLESWTAEYRAKKVDNIERRGSRRRTGSRSLTPDAELFLKIPKSAKTPAHPTDGRRLTFHARGLECFVVESTEKWEPEPFVAVPRFEIAMSTKQDSQGPLFHINSHIRTLLIQYSLYRHYACGVATSVIRKAFLRTRADIDEAERTKPITGSSIGHLSPLSPLSPDSAFGEEFPAFPFSVQEMVTVDLKASLVQVKAIMPADPPIMIQVYGLETGRHRWSPPFLQAKLVRLYAEAPKMRQVWARVVSIKAIRVDLREHRRKLSNGQLMDEKMIDVNSEAVRIAVPHQLVIHKIFDNFINTLKATQQLHHRFVTGTNEYILEKEPQGPKKIPKISLRSRALLFEIEDGAFEWKLGSIYRAGLAEQQQRLAREAAFQVKANKIEEEEKRNTNTARNRNRSAHPRSRSNHPDELRQRSKSETGVSWERHRSNSTGRGRKMRYDPDGVCGISASAKISISEAHDRLQRHNSQSWKKRIDMVFGFQRRNMKELRGVFWGPDELPDDMEETENILEVPNRPALMGTLISDLHVTIDKPTFAMKDLPDFLHQVGKGMPRDMKYSLLVPMHVQIDMGEARVTLRDYPLPLLHVPAIKPGKSPRLPAWSLKTNFVIAEEFRGRESTRHVKVNIVPRTSQEVGGFAIDVHRTVAPVKSYSDIHVDINTSFPTRITWGTSYQPAIQDMMMVLETFSKQQVDPSDRTGFWDKIRLTFHSRVTVAWKGDGDVHLMLKGTRDPYLVTGNGAGFLMCWRNDVRWNIYREDDPRKFMTVDSGEYVLAIPDFSHQARNTAKKQRDKDDDGESAMSSDSFRRGAAFKKVVMKLSGNVQWLAGLMFERSLGQGKRSFDFEPHYNVILREPRYAKAPPGLDYDAFRGFRSQHIHMSIAVKAPVGRDWSVNNDEQSKSYNTVHLSPRFFTHFYAWWSMFGGSMSLPIRQGKLWPGVEKSSKKFGRHLSTIKYNLLLAPLFLSHVYKHKEAEDFAEDVVSATGLKIRLDSFMLDVHQRREEFHTHDKGKKTSSKTSGMKMHRAQLDLVRADIRAISASIAGTTPEDLRKASAPSILVSQQDQVVTDLSHFEIPDNDFSWIDMDDFVELDWILPSEANPETKIMPLAYAPRFTYFRQTDHGDTISGDPDRTSPFGNEPTHFCIMSKDDDPRLVQRLLIQARLDQLNKQMEQHTRALGDAQLNYIRNETDATLKATYEQLSRHDTIFREKKQFLVSMLLGMSSRIHKGEKNAVPDGYNDSHTGRTTPENDLETEGMDSNPGADFVSDFNNRFVIHNMQLKWNNMLRNIILRYIHQVSQRRGFVYYLSRPAVKFILDIVEEQCKAKAPKSRVSSPEEQPSKTSSTKESTEDDGSSEVEARIREILADGKKFVNADDPQNVHHIDNQRVSTENLDSNIAQDFTPQNSYHLRLIAPQIQLQSEKNPKAVVLVTAKGMELKVVEVMDKDRIFDDVSGLVQRRFAVEMDSTQFFVTHQKWYTSQMVSLYSGSHYGTPAGSAWPPWVPMEVMFDFSANPFGFTRVVQKTSASLRYDKYNTLRLKYNDEINGNEEAHPTVNNIESRMDHLWVEFPQIRALCSSAQYYAMYIIVLDLLMYSEPLEKTRSERLEKIMLASDFSDLRGAPEMVIRLQERIRQLEEIKTQFQINSKYLDRKGWEDRIALDRDLTSCEDELFFMMKAITTSQRKHEGSQTSGLLRWNISSDQIVWHLLRDNNQPLMEFQLQKAEYDRTDNSDGSHINLMQIGKIVGLNLLPDAIYPEMFAPYSDAERGAFNEGGNQQMLRVYWYMLEAIAGIPVMDHFEVNLFPMKIQLEREVGKRLFEYMFPGSKDDGSGKNASPFMVKNMQPVDDDDEEETHVRHDSGGSANHLSAISSDRRGSASAIGTRAGSLELRLRPTLTSDSRPATASLRRGKAMHSAQNSDSGYHFRLFQPRDKSSSSTKAPSIRSLGKRNSLESLTPSLTPRPMLNRAGTSATNIDKASINGDTKSSRFAIHRNNSKQKEKPSDDLTKMMSRASNYMTLAYVKIPSVVLCLSYKGKGERNLEDVHDFVFRLPMIEYRNKTWSNLDLALALKKDVIRALISHTGAIIGNKFSKHRPNTAQQTRLRELATSSVLLTPSSNDNSNDNSESSSIVGYSPTDTRHSERSKSPRRSMNSTRTGSGVTQLDSPSSSLVSLQSYPRNQNFSNSLAMTPVRKENAESIFNASTETGTSTRVWSDNGGGGGNAESRNGGNGGLHSSFVTDTLRKLKKRDHPIFPMSASGQAQDDEETDRASSKRKTKSLLSKVLN